MKTVNIGPIKEIRGKDQVFEVPLGAKRIIRNPESGQIQFEIDEKWIAGKDFQYKNEETGKWVKVDFKQTPGQFKGVMVYEV